MFYRLYPSMAMTNSRPILLLPALVLVGCASPGIPRPPSLNLSRPVDNLAAQRIGDTVVLTWTTPDRTTDNLDLKVALTARICRRPVPVTQQPVVTQQPAACLEVSRHPTKPGPGTATDPLPAVLTAEPASLLEYSVEILNPAGRSAGLSTPAYTAAGTAPTPIEALHATPISTGIMLEWSTPPVSPSSTSVDLIRTDITLQDQQKQAQSTTKPAAKQPIKLAGKPSVETHLRVQLAASNPATADSRPDGGSNQPSLEPKGTLDNTAHFGDTYSYTAQRLRTVQLGTHTITLESPISAPVTLALHDIFPPAIPTGLVAIPNRQPPSIDLSWQPNSEPDLAGYLVYRHGVSSGASFARLTPGPIPATDFRDTTAVAGQRYSYSVTAIDASGNESKPSQPAEEGLEKN